MGGPRVLNGPLVRFSITGKGGKDAYSERRPGGVRGNRHRAGRHGLRQLACHGEAGRVGHPIGVRRRTGQPGRAELSRGYFRRPQSAAPVPAGYTRVGGAAQGISIAAPASWVAINPAKQTIQSAANSADLKGISSAELVQDITSLQKLHGIIVFDVKSAAGRSLRPATSTPTAAPSGVTEEGRRGGVPLVRQEGGGRIQAAGLATHIAQRDLEIGGVPSAENLLPGQLFERGDDLRVAAARGAARVGQDLLRDGDRRGRANPTAASSARPPRPPSSRRKLTGSGRSLADDLHCRSDRYDGQMPYRRMRAQRAPAAGRLARPVAELRRRVVRSRPSARSCAAPSTSASPTSTSPTTTGRPTARPRRTSGAVRARTSPYRDELVISTKAGYDMWPGPYGEWGSRKYLLASLDQRLKRMGWTTSTSSTPPLRPRHAARGDDGRARPGRPVRARRSTSASPPTGPSGQREAAAILRGLGTPLLIHQPSYSMLNRWVEDGLLDALRRARRRLHRVLPARAGRC